MGRYKNEMNEAEFTTRYQKIRDQGSVVYVYKLEGKMIATGKLLIEYKFNDSVGHIEDVVVDRAYRHKGYGTKIVQALAKLAGQSKCYKVILVTRDGLEPFYSKAGLAKVGIHMSKTLT